ncbi:hypothetical protein BKA93DRAFT_722007 [Sparassis latifolia]|uniref:RFX-type winged-helix domain-containing protein n=1 Tax=Sparassis crispa TaxID=139825 RepID=A0A401G6F0_9APHY|nr:hypothetical protein SCP_0106200 [Sparassis crispa]GBE77738.1 hypothetical protein SCP_0106200 [Sparassis crispa]
MAVPNRPATHTAQTQLRPNVTDDYERWYTESAPNNRMLLSLRSGIDSEVTWALDRLCRLCNNEQFVLRAIPGLTDALFEWPDWYVGKGGEECTRMAALFALPQDLEKMQRHALESLFVLRNSAVNEPNADELSGHQRTRALILLALHNVKPDSDANTEFLLYIIELLQAIAPTSVLPPPDAPATANPIPPLRELAGSTSNRSLIIASLSTLSMILSNPPNLVHLTEDSSALKAAIRVLPLFVDKPLIEAAMNYLYTHLSYPPMSKAFLLHPQMPATMKLLVSFILSEQIEEIVSVGIGGPVHTALAQVVSTKDHELTQEELDRLVPMPEPQRCYEWMKTMFVAKPDGELTQVDFWNLYKDVFTPYQDRYHLLVASDVIKNVNLVFTQAQAMVLPGPPQRFVVRGVDRRKELSAMEQFRCLWDRSQCSAAVFGSTGELYEHILQQHINTHEGSELSCSWASCTHPPLTRAHIRGHVLTHLPNMQESPRDPSQSDVITLPSEDFPHPTNDPTTRPAPPPRSPSINYKRPIVDPPSSALTALLCMRLLFRASFASSDAAPRVDEDHFGFPGVVEETEDKEAAMELSGGTESEKEGERRGRKAFMGIRHLLEGVRIRDDALMGWITEMVDAGITGTT